MFAETFNVDLLLLTRIQEFIIHRDVVGKQVLLTMCTLVGLVVDAYNVLETMGITVLEMVMHTHVQRLQDNFPFQIVLSVIILGPMSAPLDTIVLVMVINTPFQLIIIQMDPV